MSPGSMNFITLVEGSVLIIYFLFDCFISRSKEEVFFFNFALFFIVFAPDFDQPEIVDAAVNSFCSHLPIYAIYQIHCSGFSWFSYSGDLNYLKRRRFRTPEFSWIGLISDAFAFAKAFHKWV